MTYFIFEKIQMHFVHIKMMHVKVSTVWFLIRNDMVYQTITFMLMKTGDPYSTSIMENEPDMKQKNYVNMMVLIYHFRDFPKKMIFIESILLTKAYGLMLKMIQMWDSVMWMVISI